MSSLEPIADGVFGVCDVLRMPLGARLPVRMTVLRAEEGLVLVSPVPIDDALAASIDALGRVRAIVAPSLVHHLFLPAAAKRWPDAKVFGPATLGEKKRRDVRFDGRPSDLSDVVTGIDVVRIEGAPSFDEHCFVHRASRTAVVTDLLFNVRQARGMTWFVLALVSGAYGGPKASRLWRLMARDRAALRQSLDALLARDFDRLVVAHGDVVDADAKRILADAWSWLAAPRAAALLTG